MDPQKKRALLEDDVGFQEELIQRLERAEIPPPEPQKMEALLEQLYPLVEQPARVKDGTGRRLLRCMLLELQTVPLAYALAGLGIAVLSVLLAISWKPWLEFSWAVLLPALPMAAGLLFLFGRRYAELMELSMTFLFDYKQLILARTILAGGYALVADIAVLAAIGGAGLTDCLLFVLSLILCCAAALRFIRHTNGIVGSVIILLCWGCGAFVMGMESVRGMLEQHVFMLAGALVLGLLLLWWRCRRFYRLLDRDLHTGREYRI